MAVFLILPVFLSSCLLHEILLRYYLFFVCFFDMAIITPQKEFILTMGVCICFVSYCRCLLYSLFTMIIWNYIQKTKQGFMASQQAT